jgi:transposase-like protein
VSEKKRTFRQFTLEQKTEIVLAGIRADRSVRDVCREHEISEALYYDWRDQLLEGGRAALANPRSRTPEAAEAKELRHDRYRYARHDRAPLQTRGAKTLVGARRLRGGP